MRLQDILDLFHVSTHEKILRLASDPETDGMAVYEQMMLGSSSVGNKQVIPVGRKWTVTSLDHIPARIGDVPSRFAEHIATWVKPDHDTTDYQALARESVQRNLTTLQDMGPRDIQMHDELRDINGHGYIIVVDGSKGHPSSVCPIDKWQPNAITPLTEEEIEEDMKRGVFKTSRGWRTDSVHWKWVYYTWFLTNGFTLVYRDGYLIGRLVLTRAYSNKEATHFQNAQPWEKGLWEGDIF